MSLRICKVEQLWNVITQLLEWCKFKTMLTPNADEDVEQQGYEFTVDGGAKWYSHSARQFGTFLQNQINS